MTTESNNRITTRSAEKEKISTATQIFEQACERSYNFPSCTGLVISNMLGFHFTCKKSLFFFLVQKQYQRMQNEKRPHNANRKLKV